MKNLIENWMIGQIKIIIEHYKNENNEIKYQDDEYSLIDESE